jgi:hypothetical protein
VLLRLLVLLLVMVVLLLLLVLLELLLLLLLLLLEQQLVKQQVLLLLLCMLRVLRRQRQAVVRRVRAQAQAAADRGCWGSRAAHGSEFVEHRCHLGGRGTCGQLRLLCRRHVLRGRQLVQRQQLAGQHAAADRGGGALRPLQLRQLVLVGWAEQPPLLLLLLEQQGHGGVGLGGGSR